MTDFRALCVELTDALDKLNCSFNVPNQSGLVERASDALAEPEPEPPSLPEITHDGSSNKPTAKELQSLWQACNSPSVFARAVLARWGNHPASPDSSTQPS